MVITPSSSQSNATAVGAGFRRKGYASPQVSRLVERIRALVAEQRRLEKSGDADRLDSRRRQIARLKSRLADVVRRELRDATPAPCG
jgi:hypothetical protein